MQQHCIIRVVLSCTSYIHLCYAQNRPPARTGTGSMHSKCILPKPAPSMYIILFLTKKILIEYLSTQKNNEILRIIQKITISKQKFSYINAIITLYIPIKTSSYWDSNHIKVLTIIT